ncbi:MAG: cell division ATPase MinD [Candidatus Nanoarchaeia archaeon]|jgi:septum site-determining protein MinD
MTKVVCIASGKGGVGKTTSVVNLGSALSKFGYDTIIVDGNIGTPDLGMHLGMSNNGTSFHDVLKGDKSIYESVYIHPNGSKVIPSSINMWGVLNLSKDRIKKEINRLNGLCDIVLIDCAPGINDESTACIKACDEVIIITNPDVPSVTDALKTISLANQNGKQVVGAIINKSAGKNYEMSTTNIQEFLGVPVISVVPDDNNVRRSLNEMKAVVDSYPYSKASIGFKKAAAIIVGQEYKDLEKQGFIARLAGLFRK